MSRVDLGREGDARPANFICASASRGRVGERAGHLLLNALHCTSADAALPRDLAYAFAATQMSLDAFFKRGIDPRPTELLALRYGALKASIDALADHAALKLGKRAADLKHQLACRCRRCHPLGAKRVQGCDDPASRLGR